VAQAPQDHDHQNADDAAGRVDALDAELARLAEDDRIESGVPDHLRSSDDEFLAMSGLTAPEAEPHDQEPSEGQAPSEPEEADTDTSKPLSFYEQGIEDVDAAANYEDAGHKPFGEEEIAANVFAQSPVSGLRDIIADLAQPSDTPRPAAADPEASDAPEHVSIDIPSLLDQVKSEILDNLKDDIHALADAQRDVAESQRATADALAEQRALVEEIKSSHRPEAPPHPGDNPGPVNNPEDQTGQGPDQAPAHDNPPEHESAIPSSDETADAGAHDVTGPPPPPEIEEAERLIHELQEQPRASQDPPDDSETPPVEPIDLDALDVPAPTEKPPEELDDESALPENETFGDESDATIYNRPRKPRQRKASRRWKRRRRIVAAVAVLIGATFVAIAVITTYPSLAQSFLSPDKLYNQANQLEEQGKYMQAGGMYREFYEEYPDDPRAPRALFMAGYVLLAVPPNLGAEPYQDAIQTLDQFVQTFPESEETPRARVLKGIAYYKMHDYNAAISHLSVDSAFLQRDPAAALPALRTAARAHAARGDFDDARSKLLQAASLPGNYHADEDLAELADLAVQQATKTPNQAKQEELFGQAIEYLNEALMSHAIAPTRKKQLEMKLASVKQLADEGIEVEATGAVTQVIPPQPNDAAPIEPRPAPGMPLDEAAETALGPVTQESDEVVEDSADPNDSADEITIDATEQTAEEPAPNEAPEDAPAGAADTIDSSPADVERPIATELEPDVQENAIDADIQPGPEPAAAEEPVDFADEGQLPRDEPTDDTPDAGVAETDEGTQQQEPAPMAQPGETDVAAPDPDSLDEMDDAAVEPPASADDAQEASNALGEGDGEDDIAEPDGAPAETADPVDDAQQPEDKSPIAPIEESEPPAEGSMTLGNP